MKIITTVLLCVFSFSIYAQLVDRDPTRLVTGTGFINTRAIIPELIGKTVVFPQNEPGSIYLSNGTKQENILINYDLANKSIVLVLNRNEFEIKTTNVDSVVLLNRSQGSKFYNGKFFEGITSESLVQVLYVGKTYSLIKEFMIEVVEPNYNAAMNVGSTDYVITRKDKYYLSGGLYNFYSMVKLNRKTLLQLDASGNLKNELKGVVIKPEDDDQFINMLQRIEELNN